jgi:hypothetical protein
MKHPWYASGDLFFPKPIREVLETYLIGNDTSLFYINLWSFMHLLSGVLFSLVSNSSLQDYVVIHTTWELWQIYIKMTPIHTVRGAIDIFTDTIMGIIGFIISETYTPFKQI